MEHITITFKNLTGVPIEVYRSNIVSTKALKSGEETSIPVLDRDCIHIHSSIGSGIIFRNDSPFSYKSFGKLTMIYRQDKNIVLEILEKK